MGSPSLAVRPSQSELQCGGMHKKALADLWSKLLYKVWRVLHSVIHIENSIV